MKTQDPGGYVTPPVDIIATCVGWIQLHVPKNTGMISNVYISRLGRYQVIMGRFSSVFTASEG